MEQKNVLTRILAIAGTILVWFPILAPILFSLIFFLQAQIWRIDYLMPAELFFSFLLGSVLLLWATWRAHAHRKLIAWGLGLAIFVLFAGQVIASVSGLASGDMEPTGWIWGLVIISLAVYVLGIILVGLGGIFLLKDIFNKRPSMA